MPEADPLDPEYLALAADRKVHVELQPGNDQRLYQAVVIAPDQRGLLSKAAGVLTLNSLRVHSASVNIQDGIAVISEFVVSPYFGSPPAAGLLRQQLIRALGGQTDVLGTLEERAGAAHPKPARRRADRGSGSSFERPAADLVVRRRAGATDCRDPGERPPRSAGTAHRCAGACRG